jgi:hypothetical protein
VCSPGSFEEPCITNGLYKVDYSKGNITLTMTQADTREYG